MQESGQTQEQQHSSPLPGSKLVQLQLHDVTAEGLNGMTIDMSGFGAQLYNTDSYYSSYYASQSLPPQSQPQLTRNDSSIIMPTTGIPSSGCNNTRRPLRPAGTTTATLSAPSAASSHVRTLPAKATAATAASGASVANAAVANQSAFINKLYTMLEEADQTLLSWDETGTFFIVKNTTDFSKTVLPLYFKHNNFASFVRQLNMYGFHKINDSFFKLNNTCSEVWEFKHHDFRRGEYHLLSNIKRKAPKSLSAAKSKNRSANNNNSAALPSNNTFAKINNHGMFPQNPNNPNNQKNSTSRSNSSSVSRCSGIVNNSVSDNQMCILPPNMMLQQQAASNPASSGFNQERLADFSSFTGGFMGVGNGLAFSGGVTDSGAGGNDGSCNGDFIADLHARIYELEHKLATLSESYELVCEQSLNCKKEISEYGTVIQDIVSFLAGMTQNNGAAARKPKRQYEKDEDDLDQEELDGNESTDQGEGEEEEEEEEGEEVDGNNEQENGEREDTEIERIENTSATNPVGIATISSSATAVSAGMDLERKDIEIGLQNPRTNNPMEMNKSGKRARQTASVGAQALMTPPIGTTAKIGTNSREKKRLKTKVLDLK
ncbi:hypothetical protein HK100_011634 [Physocladia obscura]|uniref:HSF-type DNA-binding domain-containing protein n=1 Tax=Physocladia obscura TaxID=109957 RepID=A0AAD5T2N0_9FUNG|nr:hypothetical protein HK100_011634 [Physocladia obscura]